MPRDDFPVGDRHVDQPIFLNGVHSVTSTNSPDSERVPWPSVGAAATSLGAPLGIGMLHPVLGEVTAVIEIMVVLTINRDCNVRQPGSERAFRLLRWCGNRPEPPAPDA